jgi:AraC-like DNA-binding protein
MAAGGVRAFLEFAVSKGASRSALIEGCRIDPQDLADRENRIPFAKYVALMRAAQKLCNDPAISLHFGEAVHTSEITFTTNIGATSIPEALATMNRYAALTVEVDEGGGDRYVFSRSGGQLWLIDNRKNPNEFHELRHKMALHYLSSKKSSVSQTAHLVGFSDPASFSRAFKRWTGSSPRARDVSGAS